MKTLARHCLQCRKYYSVEVHGQEDLFCPGCSTLWGKVGNLDEMFDSCPICQCRQFYTSKDFNQFWGCLIMLAGIILVPWTYGLSLPVFAGIDWIFHQKVPTILNCYKCGSEFRGLMIPPQFKPFMHHIGLKYDKFR